MNPNPELFDTRSGKFIAPSPDTINALTPDVRAAVESVRMASEQLDAANLAVETNADKLKSVQAEIAAIEKKIPRLTFHDLIKAQIRDTQLRRAGLT